MWQRQEKSSFEILGGKQQHRRRHRFPASLARTHLKFLEWPSQVTCRRLIIFAKSSVAARSRCTRSVYCGIMGWRRLARTPSSALSSCPGWHYASPAWSGFITTTDRHEQMRFCAAVSDAASAQPTSQNLASYWRRVTISCLEKL